MSSRQQQIAHLISKINHQISTLKDHFRAQKQLRSEKLRAIEDSIEEQTDVTLKVMEKLMAECHQVDSLWSSILEWKFRQECADVWDSLQREKMERIRDTTRHIKVSLHDILKKETEKVLHHVPQSLHEHLQQSIEEFRERKENTYNDYAFAHDLHRISEMNSQEELDLISEEIAKYYDMSRTVQKRIRSRNRKRSRESLQSHVDEFIEQKRAEHAENRNDTFEHYLKVSREELIMLDAEMQESVKLALSEKQRKDIFYKTSEQAQNDAIKRELSTILAMEPFEYKTDIGIHDEVMQELQYEIEQWHEYTIMETDKYNDQIAAVREENEVLTREIEELKQSVHTLRRQQDKANSELAFLHELSQLSEDDLTREIKRKSANLENVRSQIETMQHEAQLIEVSQNALQKDLEQVNEQLSTSREQYNAVESIITETTEELTNQRRIAENVLPAEVWTVWCRFEMRDEQARQRHQRQLSECCKSAAEAVMNSLLASMYDSTTDCLRTESEHLTQLSYTSLHGLLATVYRDYKIRERTFLSHSGFLKAVYDPSANLRKPDKILKKQQTLWQKRFALWEKIQDDFVATACTSENLSAFRMDLMSRSSIDIVSEHLWTKQEVGTWISSAEWSVVLKSNDDLRNKARHLSDYCKRLFTKFQLYEWYLYRERSTRRANLEFDLESPYVALTQNMVAKDETISDPMLLKITESLHPCQMLKDKEQEVSDSRAVLLEDCKKLRKGCTNLSKVDSLALSEAIILIKQKHNQKYREKE